MIDDELRNPVEENARQRNMASDIYEEFQNSTAFIDQLNLRRDIKRCINFVSGRQWNMDEDLKDFPKITLNVVKQIGKVRKSNILQNEYGFLVNSSALDDIRKIQDFLKHLHDSKLKMKRKDLKVINDTFTKGTGLMYFYWDAEKRDFLSKSGGKLKAEAIDIRRFRVADPYVQDLQDQEYVMYVTRERISSILDKYGVEVEAEAEIYTKDTEKTPAEVKSEREFTNVYTKFYRNYEGQVFFVISTKNKILQKPTPLNPYYEGSSSQAPDTMSTMDTEKRSKFEEEVFNLYPFSSLVFDERDNCFYGIPGAMDILEAQKSINQHFSVYDKGIQDNVLGGFVHKKGIMGEQEITTENGQIIELDLLPSEKWQDVFGRIPVNQVPPDSLNYSGNLMGVLRQVSGASSVQIGEADYSGQSGKATEMLLERAKQNSTDLAMLFNEYKIEQAEIMFLFAKFYYDNEEFTVVEHGFEEDEKRTYKGENKFNGNKYIKEDISIDIKVGPAPSFSEYANIDLLGKMVQSGQAPFEVYIASLPDGFVSNKKELLKMARQNSQKEIEHLQKQLEQAQKVMEQMSEAFKQTQKDRKNIDTIINENERLKSMLAELSSKSIEITQEASKENQELTENMQHLIRIINKQGKGTGQNNTQNSQNAKTKAKS